MTEITIHDITKTYGSDSAGVIAVDSMDLQIADGEFLVLVGPSGCGKTTTLRCLAGLESVTDGTITFDDQNVTSLRARDRNVAMVFQNYALYPHMSARQNMEFGLRLSTEMSTDEIRNRVKATAEMMGIKDYLDSSPSELSGGQQQRVALGRAIVRDPEVFLMDEPLSNLDAKLRTQMRTELQELQQQLDVTTVYVTHDQVEAMAMGDRIAVLNGGELQQVGPPEQVYRHPANEFVADFIGSPSINLFSADVEGRTLSGAAGSFTYNLSDPDPVADMNRIRVGIRPEDLRVVPSGELTATVSVAEHMGNENYIYLEAGDVEFTTRIDSTVRPSSGESVDLTFDERALYLFDPDTGEAQKTKQKHADDDPARAT